MPDEDEAVDLRPLIMSQLVWDLIEHDKVKAFINLLGLTPASDEALELDHRACHARAEYLRPLVGAISVYSDLLAEIHAAYVIDEAGDALDESERDEAREQYQVIAQNIISTSVLSVIGEFLQEGLLTYGKELVSR